MLGPPISSMNRLICWTRVVMSMTRFGSTVIVGSSLAAAIMAFLPFLPPLFRTRGSAAAASRANSRSFLNNAFLARSFFQRSTSSGGRSLYLSFALPVRRCGLVRTKTQLKRHTCGLPHIYIFEVTIEDSRENFLLGFPILATNYLFVLVENVLWFDQSIVS